MVNIEMANGKNIKIELYPDVAPITVANFEKLVKEGFYDGLIFHRVISGFMIQGGDPMGTGMGGAKEKIKGEFLANGVRNDLKHTRGVISMARSAMPNSASSQFFIMHQDAPHLDGQYAAFGKVVEGMDVVDLIYKRLIVEIYVNCCDLVNNVHALDYLAECCILSVKKRSVLVHDKEL
jgi:peptidyl-prolyl cis-trans isomerase B (cyclophilin B)